MKRYFVLMMVALMSVVIVDAKTVRGYVSDREGKPVVGLKMAVVKVDRPDQKFEAVTDKDGFFSVLVPDDLDTSDLVKVFGSPSTRVVQYRETVTGIRIVIEPVPKTKL